MSVKKIIDTEPKWEVKKGSVYKTKKPSTHSDSVAVTLTTSGTNINSDKVRLTASFRFGEDYLNVFGEKYLVFSNITDENRIYFKIDDYGYKCVRYKASARCQFALKQETASKFIELWCGKQYKVMQERWYYYIERTDPLEALFDDPPEDEITEVTMNRLKKGKALPVETKKPKSNTFTPPVNSVFMAPMPESGIKDKKVLAVITRMKEKGYVSMYDIKGMGMNDKEYYKAVGELLTVYGYTIVDIPCIDHTGKRFFIKSLFNGTGEFK